jgi:hypothetical protein
MEFSAGSVARADAAFDRPWLPASRRTLLYVSTLLMFCIYYLDYTGHFEEGTLEGGSTLAFPLRLLSVSLIVISLFPLRLRRSPTWFLGLLYALSSCSLIAAGGVYGEVNDLLFFNTILQLPILFALTFSQWRIDYVRWFNLIGLCLIGQSILDLWLWLNGASLWISTAFVGGVGNPSSFGFCCDLLVAFYLFHPRAGRYRAIKAITLTLSAIMSESLFCVLSVVVIYMVWSIQTWRRAGFALIAALAVGFATNAIIQSNQKELFIIHKISAAGAFVGLVDYDTDTARSVYGRSEIHQRILSAFEVNPLTFLTGHAEHLAYWPADSQVLTYLGSFGIFALAGFWIMHLRWMAGAIAFRHSDGGFTLLTLSLFALIFFTNRILDYFPVATLYFACISLTLLRSNTKPAMFASAGANPTLANTYP